MRKIIITVIATIVLIAPFGNVKGQGPQRPQQTIITSADFPTANVLTGVNAKISFGIWRFEPFVQFGGYLQMFEERMATETWRDNWIHGNGVADGNWDWGLSSTSEFRSPRFERTAIFNLGIAFRIADRHRIKIGYRSIPSVQSPSSFGHLKLGNTYEVLEGQQHIGRGQDWDEFYLGYVHTVNLSPRVSLDLRVLYGLYWVFANTWPIPWSDLRNPPGIINTTSLHSTYGFVSLGARLNYEIVRNLKLNVQLEYTRRYRVRYEWWMEGEMENISGERLLTRNLINFSIGIHYHIQFGGQQQAQQRQPRQQVSPRHRALPCPPGQMRHNRSWDRPSSVFNHPTAR